MATSPYTSAFYDRRGEESRRSAAVVLDVVEAAGVPLGRSVLDVGCGRGAWLEVLRERGAERLVGIDGPWNSAYFAAQADVAYVPLDLEAASPAELTGAVGAERFDLGISVEVLEHLRPEGGDAVVELLAGACQVVVFSAAVPGQGGTGHQNERWQSHWAGRFAEHGLLPFDVVRPAVWEDDAVAFWYRQNVLVYARPEVLPHLAPAPAGFLDLVHPRQLEHSRRHPPVGPAARALASSAAAPARRAARRVLRRR